MKKLGTSDAWLISQQPRDPAYYIEACRIFGRKWQLEFVKQDNLLLATLGAEGTWQQRFSSKMAPRILIISMNIGANLCATIYWT